MPQRQSSWSSTFPSPRHVPAGSRECLVAGCRKKHCYATVDGQKIYSKFCPRHTCAKTVPVADGYHCSMPKEEGDAYCTKHMTCAAEGCRKTGSFTDDSFPWYCQSHRCTKDQCTAGAYDLLKKRCKKHQECEALHCSAPPDWDSHSSFCEAHTCTSGTCSLQAVAGNRCREHAKCSVPACDRPCHLRPDNGRLETLCDVHLQLKCAKPGCGGRKLHAHRRYCLDHGCRIPDCTDERYPHGGTLCTVHKCTFDACYEPIANPADPKSLFCMTHACRYPRCLFSRQPPSPYCADHQCRQAGCLKGSQCAVHTAPTSALCHVDGCGRAAADGGPFCRLLHGCVEAGCRRARLSLSLGGEEDVEGDLDRCLKHDREVQRERASRERDEWKGKYERLLAECAKMASGSGSGPGSRSESGGLEREGERKRRHATVEDSEDAGPW